MSSVWNNNWGYGATYSNPYYDSGSSGYDYSQPVVVQNYVTSDTSAAGGTTSLPGVAETAAAPVAPPAPSPPAENQQAMAYFDEGMAAFKAGNFDNALAKQDAALKLMPSDPVLHEVRALSLFALGQYKEAAATLNALLASAPGMDWTSMSSLWGNVDDYTAKLRSLEAHIKANPTDAAAAFVLAYHYLVIGQTESATKALQHVVKLQPSDATAKRMLSMLVPPEATPDVTATAAAPAATAPAATDAKPEGPATDLVGTWTASGGDVAITLTIDDESRYVWQATPKGKPAIELKGNLIASSDAIVLENEEHGSMIGRVTSGGPDKFTFTLRGMPASEPGLAFTRKKT